MALGRAVPNFDLVDAPMDLAHQVVDAADSLELASKLFDLADGEEFLRVGS